MTERPDGYIAPVTYLFGGPVEPAAEHPAGRSALPELAAATAEIIARPVAERAAEPVTRTEKRAHNVGIAALARRGVSIAEMRDLLTRRELEPDVIEQEVARLIDERLLDDAMLAESIVRISTERKGMGSSAVRAELRRRKVDPAAIESALESLDDDDEFARALDVATSRARQLASLDPETAERRLLGFLQRRGYSGSTLTRATRQALAATAVRRGPRFE